MTGEFKVPAPEGVESGPQNLHAPAQDAALNECFSHVKKDSRILKNYSGRSKQQATGLRAASVGAKRVPPGLSTPRITCALAAFAAFV